MTIVQEKIAWEALKWCEENDKSSEFTIQCIMDVTEAKLDDVLNFLKRQDATKKENL